MYIRQKIKLRIFLIALIVIVFIYWRGIKAVTEEKGWTCSYHIAYAVCNPKNNKAQLPSLWDIMKAGVKF